MHNLATTLVQAFKHINFILQTRVAELECKAIYKSFEVYAYKFGNLYMELWQRSFTWTWSRQDRMQWRNSISSTKRAIWVGFKSPIDASNMIQMQTFGQPPNLLAFLELGQAHSTRFFSTLLGVLEDWNQLRQWIACATRPIFLIGLRPIWWTWLTPLVAAANSKKMVDYNHNCSSYDPKKTNKKWTKLGAYCHPLGKKVWHGCSELLGY